MISTQRSTHESAGVDRYVATADMNELMKSTYLEQLAPGNAYYEYFIWDFQRLMV